MKQPIDAFLKEYCGRSGVRFHMPGHKGTADPADITEVLGADALYEADGIIAKSEENATRLFGTKRTFYSTEGSSQCIKAMILLAMQHFPGRRTILAARNCHKAFLYACALLDAEPVWLWPEEERTSICACPVSAAQVESVLSSMEEPPFAVYLTSPDYLGGEADIAGISAVCKKYRLPLLVDNAHGAYLHFLDKSTHPMDLGADLCCDSAHKTLHALTGTAYLHVANSAPEDFADNAKEALIPFGSTSPSYLLLRSLDLVNVDLSDNYRQRLKETIQRIASVRTSLLASGWKFVQSDPLKMTIVSPSCGIRLANHLRHNNIECEYADPDYVVLMATPDNKPDDYERLLRVLKKIPAPTGTPVSCSSSKPPKVFSLREALLFRRKETIALHEAKGRILASPSVACPPAVPIAVSGERLLPETIMEFKRYGISHVEVIIE